MTPVSASTASDLAFLSKRHTVNVTENITYGTGGIGYSREHGATRMRDLLLDMYAPAEPANHPRPALIMAFGGSFHRGTKADDTVTEGEHRNTPVSAYCREFARRGYVCFSIDYRLMQEAPDPGITPTMPPGTPFNVDRINHVRDVLNLPPCTQQMMGDEIEAATDDMVKAVSFVRSRAKAFNVDFNRIAIGGFSAGAVIALNAALAERAPAAAVVALSGRITLPSAQAYINGEPGEPPLLMFLGENDLPVMLENLDEPAAHMRKMALPHRIVRIAGATHFYPATSPVETQDGTHSDVETEIARFLYQHMRLAALKAD